MVNRKASQKTQYVSTPVSSLLQTLHHYNKTIRKEQFILTTSWGLAENKLVLILTDEFTAGDAFSWQQMMRLLGMYFFTS